MLPSNSHLKCTEQFQDISPAWSDVWAFSTFQVYDLTTYYWVLCIMSWSHCQNLHRYGMVHTTIFNSGKILWPHWYLHLRTTQHTTNIPSEVLSLLQAFHPSSPFYQSKEALQFPYLHHLSQHRPFGWSLSVHFSLQDRGPPTCSKTNYWESWKT